MFVIPRVVNDVFVSHLTTRTLTSESSFLTVYWQLGNGFTLTVGNDSRERGASSQPYL